MGIGAVDTTDPHGMRMLGMHGAAFANYAVDDCDFLIAVGARFDDRVAGVPAKFARNAKRIAHLDIDRAEVEQGQARALEPRRPDPPRRSRRSPRTAAASASSATSPPGTPSWPS